MTFDNLNSLFSYIERQVQETMKTDVAQTVKQTMSKAVNSAVYNTYEPRYYKRRMSNGGLSDDENYSVTEIEKGIDISNDTPLDNGRNKPRLDEIIVYGYGRQPFERDFYKETLNELERTEEHKSALIYGLNVRGIDIY